MPRGDRTGPAGQGPMTGRKTGRCAGNDGFHYGNKFLGRGFSRGFGFGNYSQKPFTETSEKNRIETAINALKSQLQNLEKRRDEMSK